MSVTPVWSCCPLLLLLLLLLVVVAIVPVPVPVSACLPPEGGFPRGEPSRQALVMWVSSGVYTPEQLGGAAGADVLCNSMQPTGTIGDWEHLAHTRHALLSYSTQDAITRLTQDIDIVNTRGDCIASSRESLFFADGALKLGDVMLDEEGKVPEGVFDVFTGTNQWGFKAGKGFDSSIPPGNDDPIKYCNDWTVSVDPVNDPSGTLLVASAIGELVPNGDDPASDEGSNWVQFLQGSGAKCNVPQHIYCISSGPSPTLPTGAQDPQFVGLQGQHFQVHGIPEEYFNLLSHPFLQLNSHFTYLASGHCHYNDTACWTHPGTYVNQLGVMVPGYEIAVIAGTHEHGMTISINGQQLKPPAHAQAPVRWRAAIHIDNDTHTDSEHQAHTRWLEPDVTAGTGAGAGSGADSGSGSGWLSSATVSVQWLSRGHVLLSTPVASIDIHNADHFFNFALELHAPRLLVAGAPLHRVSPPRARTHALAHAAGAGAGAGAGVSASISPANSPHPAFPMHGLVGQTWKNVKYPHGRLYAGEVDDYMLSDRRLFSTSFLYNEYQY